MGAYHQPWPPGRRMVCLDAGDCTWPCVCSKALPGLSFMHYLPASELGIPDIPALSGQILRHFVPGTNILLHHPAPIKVFGC